MTIIIHNLLQRSPEWHEARKNVYITGSNVNDILRPRETKTYEKLVYEKAYKIRNNFQSAATEHGVRYEDKAIKFFEELTKLKVIEVGFVTNSKYDGYGASPDGLIGDKELIEVKCPFSRQIKKGQVPPSYYHQIQLQLLVTNRNRCHFFEAVIKDDKIIDYNHVIVNKSYNWYLTHQPKLQQFIIDVKAQRNHCILDSMDHNGFKRIHFEEDQPSEHLQHQESSYCHSEQQDHHHLDQPLPFEPLGQFVARLESATTSSSSLDFESVVSHSEDSPRSHQHLETETSKEHSQQLSEY